MRRAILFFICSIGSFLSYGQNDELLQDSVPSDVIDLPNTSFRASLLYPMVGTFEFTVERFLPDNKSIVVSPSVSYSDNIGYGYYYYDDNREFLSSGVDIAIRSYKGSMINRERTTANIYFEYGLGVDWSKYSGSYSSYDSYYDPLLGYWTSVYTTHEVNEEVFDFRGTLAIGTHFVFKRFLSIDSNIGIGFRYSQYSMDASVADDLDIGESILDVGYKGVVPKFTIAIGAANYKK